MKYYHLIYFSVGVLLIQFFIQKVFHFNLPLLVYKLFFFCQAFLLAAYSLLTIVFFVKKSKQKKAVRQKNVLALQQADKERKASYLKAS